MLRPDFLNNCFFMNIKLLSGQKLRTRDVIIFYIDCTHGSQNFTENSVIRFYADNAKTDIRIGGREQATFDRPHFVSADENYVYVCCNHMNVRRIDKKTLSVSDVNRMYNGLTGYFKFGKFAIITTLDGAYCDKD